MNNEEPWDELVVRHEPKLPSCSVKEVIQASKIGHLNIEKLLMDTIQVNIWIIELINKKNVSVSNTLKIGKTKL